MYHTLIGDHSLNIEIKPLNYVRQAGLECLWFLNCTQLEGLRHVVSFIAGAPTNHEGQRKSEVVYLLDRIFY